MMVTRGKGRCAERKKNKLGSEKTESKSVKRRIAGDVWKKKKQSKRGKVRS